ncbi:hypothetical protein N9Z01_06780 [Flavobacteriaceae bacterium]|nr:hypothetical protein [Flavobacteriaceae bacterium]
MSSEDNLISPFPGIRPYSRKEAENFYGREREVEDVLGILKRYKLVTICGKSGSGKSSLIAAGILPKLQKGFLGQAGKEWVICDFRPGISPLENLSYALSDSGVMYLKSKSKTTDHQNYKNKIEEKRDLGLIEIFASSEIYEKKNLLIVIDQLEDFFKFPDFFDPDQTNDDDLLFDLIYRTSKYKQTSIYFILALDIDYIAKLNSYDRFTEILNQTQYNLPHLGKSALLDITKNTLQTKNIQLSEEVLDDLGDNLNDNPSLLPDIQSLFSSIYVNYGFPMSKDIVYLDEEQLTSFGNHNHNFVNKLEAFYQKINEAEKKHFELLMRSLCSGEEKNGVFFNNTIDYIYHLLNISDTELTELIKKIKNEFGATFDIFKAVIRGEAAEDQKVFKKTDVVSLKYQSILKWNRFLEWKEDEKEKFEIYKENYFKAKKYPDESLLTATSLEIASEWLKNKFIHKEWSNKYSFNFQLTKEYITKSKEADDRAFRRQQEFKKNLARSKKRNRNIGLFLAASVLIFFIVFSISRHLQTIKLNEEKALVSKEKEKVDSLFKGLNELILKDSINNAELLIEQRLKMNLVEEQLMSQKRLIALSELNEKQNKLIEAKRDKIYRDSIAANELMGIALKESKRAELSQKFIDIKDSLSLILYTLNNTTLNEYDKELLKKLTKNSINYYQELKNLGQQLNREHDDDNLRQISVNLIAKLNGVNQYSKIEKYDLVKDNAMSLNAINISSNGKLATGGRSKILYSSNNSFEKNIQALEAITNFSSAINSLEFLNDNLIAVGLENSEIWLVEINSKRKVRAFEIKDWKPGKKLKKSIQNIASLVANFNKIHFKGIGFLEYDRVSNKLYATLEKSMIEIDLDKIDEKNKNYVRSIELKNLSEDEFITSMAFSDLSGTIYLATNQGNVIVNILENGLELKLSNEFLKLRNETAIEIEFYSDKVIIGTLEGSIFVYKLQENKNLVYLGSKRANYSKVNDLLYDNKNVYVLTENGSLSIINDMNFNNLSENKKIKTPVSISLGEDNFGNAIESFMFKGTTYFVTADQIGNLVYWDLDLENTFAEINRLYTALN